uniref:Uncharacterized protein n=1 Tax=Solanum tuberosum TaxID=4113 RepID=M1DSD8_SOLTU
MYIIQYVDKITCDMYMICNKLMLICFWLEIPSSAILKWHQPSLSTTNIEAWKKKVEAYLLELENGLQYLNLIEESKYEDENAYYVIVMDRLGQSRRVQIILGANLHISILLLSVEDDDSHFYIIITENRCEEVAMNSLLAINNTEQILLQFMHYSNLEDKVLFGAWNIVMNAYGPEVGQAVGPGAKPQRGPRIRQPNY